MDLNKYKKAWINQPEEVNKVSKTDIYKMAHSRSSSIVKWIFIIGVLELIFWTSLNFILPENYIEVYKSFNLLDFINYYNVLHYIIISLFLFVFYKNYTSVSTTDNTKNLMKGILRVRKTVKYYVYYNLIGFTIITIIVNSIMFSNPEILITQIDEKKINTNISALLTTGLILEIIVILVTLLILYLFYKVSYGTLLKKLTKNYKEIDRLENLN